MSCILQKIERDIGIKKYSNSVHIHMKGADETAGPTFLDLGSYDHIAKIGEGLSNYLQ
jgi:hypothetical protein